MGDCEGALLFAEPEGGEDVLDARELAELDHLKERYERLTEPSVLAQTGEKAIGLIPTPIRESVTRAAESIAEQQFYIEAMKTIAKGFGALEEQAAKFTVNEEEILRRVREQVEGSSIGSLDELCFARSYEIAKVSEAERIPNLAAALAEGGITGLLGFAGVVPNIVTSTFCFYRAVQSIAMSYGYDVRSNPDELMIASDVFVSALSPRSERTAEMAGFIGKIMMISEAEAIKQVSKRGWAAMASRGGIGLLLTQMRALAHKAAQNALEKAGKEGLEHSVFRGILEQLGKRLSQKTIQRAVPIVSAAIGALFDAGEMMRIIEFADIFYRKRFILEKGERQMAFLSRGTEAHRADI